METFLANNSLLILIIIIFWVLPWKAVALWTAAQRNHKFWFIILLILNTLGLLEIIYTFFVAKRKPSELFRAFKTKI